MNISLSGSDIEITHPLLGSATRISLRRTTRLPVSSNRVHALPPDLGPAPVYEVQEYAPALIQAGLQSIVDTGGVVAPIEHGEAFWLDFRDARSFRPSALMVAAGLINAVTGEVWDQRLSMTPQNFMIIGGPGQKQIWLDGWRQPDGTVRQFIAVEKGSGYTVEEQISGGNTGGIQLCLYEAGLDLFPRHVAAPRARGAFSWSSWDCKYSATRSASLSCESKSLGVGAGAEIHQAILASAHGLSVWDHAQCAKIFIHLISRETWNSIAGSANRSTRLSLIVPVPDDVGTGIKSKF